MGLYRQIVEWDEFWAAYHETGGVYFIRDDKAEQVKIGFSRDCFGRKIQLQVGSANPLRLIGLIASPPKVEKMIHFKLIDGRASGEWFWDTSDGDGIGVSTIFMNEMTNNHPLYRNVWSFM